MSLHLNSLVWKDYQFLFPTQLKLQTHNRIKIQLKNNTKIIFLNLFDIPNLYVIDILFSK